MPLYSTIIRNNEHKSVIKTHVDPYHTDKKYYLLTHHPETGQVVGVNRKAGYKNGVSGFNFVPPKNSNKFESKGGALNFAKKIGVIDGFAMTQSEMGARYGLYF